MRLVVYQQGYDWWLASFFSGGYMTSFRLCLLFSSMSTWNSCLALFCASIDPKHILYYPMLIKHIYSTQRGILHQWGADKENSGKRKNRDAVTSQM